LKLKVLNNSSVSLLIAVQTTRLKNSPPHSFNTNLRTTSPSLVNQQKHFTQLLSLLKEFVDFRPPLLTGGRRFVGLVWEEKRRGSVGGRLVSEVRFLLPVTKMRVMMALISRRLWLVETWSRGGCVELAAALWLSQCWYGVDPLEGAKNVRESTLSSLVRASDLAKIFHLDGN
ncbi:hypothetical protein KCU87_g497, partial [Aureobasidium melanogenum]